ncbi:MAG: BatD family protein [Pirellulales bacterium]
MAQEPELIVEVDRTTVYLGDSITYAIMVNNAQDPSEPTLAELPDFQVEFLGTQDQNSRSMLIENGVRTEIVRRGRQYAYRLTPKTTGKSTIGAPKATIDGKDVVGRSIEITIKTQDAVRLQMSVDRPSVYPTQEFTLSLKVLIKSLPEPNSDRDPVAVLPNPPILNIPWLDDDSLPKSLKSNQPLKETLQRYLSNRGTGFGINGYRDNSPFSLLDNRPLTFQTRPKVKKIADADGQEIEFWEYEFNRTLTAGGPGTIEFVPATAKGVFATSVVRGRLQGEELFSKSQPVTVEVKDVPATGRPASYIGAVGKISLVAELSPTTAHVGDPLTLAITLNGFGQLADAQPPKLDALKAITDSFKVYEGTTQTTDESKKFSYSLRALNSSVTQLPEIEVSYFDVDSEKFVAIKTPPIAVTITEAERLSSSSVISSNNSSGESSSGLQIADGGLFGNYDQLSGLKDERPKLTFFAGLWLAMALSAFFTHAIIALVRRRNADPKRQRIKSSLARAQSILQSAKVNADGQLSGAELDRARQSLVALLADFADLPAQAISTREVDDHLSKLDVDEPLRSEVRKLLDQCDAVRFGSTSQTASLEMVQSLLVRLHQSLSQTIQLIVLLGFCVLAGCTSPASDDLNKQFVEAGRLFESAKTTEDFVNVAARYQQIVDAGLAGGAVMFNQGNAWVKAGQNGRAIACYRQALQYWPRDEHIRANLKSVLMKAGLDATKIETQNSSALNYVYFWRAWLNFKEKLVVLTVLLGLVLGSSLALWRSGASRWWIGGLLVASTIFAVPTWFDYQDQYLTERGVAISSVTAYKGTGADYGPAFTGALTEGTEFVVVDQQLDWLQIELKDLGRGWIRRDQVVIYQ